MIGARYVSGVCEQRASECAHDSRTIRYLHGDETVIDHDLLCQKVCADRGLVLVAELLVDILVHQRGLADTVTMPKAHQQPRAHSSCTSTASRRADTASARTYPESPRMMTFNRTFLRDDMVMEDGDVVVVVAGYAAVERSNNNNNNSTDETKSSQH